MEKRILFIDCSMGAAGDMLTSALLELMDNKEELLKRLNNIGLPEVNYIADRVSKQGITGTHMRVVINGAEEAVDEGEHTAHIHSHNGGHMVHSHSSEHTAHTHHNMSDIESIVRGLNLPENVKEDVLAVYRLIAEAESAVHGKPVTEIHFHEVGNLDAIADISAVCLLMNEIKADKIIATPIHVGSGEVRCAHGILPVPAPATAYLLKNIPIYGGSIRGELCTPTGAALLRHFVASYGNMPVMSTEKIGYGVGKKDFERANVLRIILGSSFEENNKTGLTSQGQVLELSCNLDDMTPEQIGFAMEVLLKKGALDVYTTPIGMKKNRLGIKLSVICKTEDGDKFIHLLFEHTTTIGIRENLFSRYTLDRSEESINTNFGKVQIKRSYGYGVTKEKYEYEDLARLATDRDISLEEIKKHLLDHDFK